MRFNCGPSPEEKHTQLKEWHSYFAIFPVRVRPSQWMWLERVERKGRWIEVYSHSFWVWEYRKP